MHDVPQAGDATGFRRWPAPPAAGANVPAARPRRQRHWRSWLAGGTLGLIVCAALLAPWLVSADPTAVSLSDVLSAPGRAHWFGTDQIGRDVLSRTVYGARVSLFVALASIALAGGVGALLGLAAGYAGGALDAIVMRIADIQLAVPALILAMVVAGAVGVTLPNLIVLLALAHWARFARVLRGEALTLRQRDFVLLARLAGVSRIAVLCRHIAPNVAGVFVVLATLDIGSVIILESTLSFLGLGIQPPLASWGAMIADGRGVLDTAWWISLAPGLALALTVLAANRLGDSLRDRLLPGNRAVI
ncbi:ABC transporter permease [Caballeronia sp. LZ034LL]|uniref:ABC transporter permease n=1 Tax=Caballeronia sp. LZ034LL TaxID=3038567 RepID=UPI0028654022|nr:ABC transporter permease [Caballeronia sp. LZ034LL]MDR5836026.1 ABC transporter permease [Caballeronia sp. LZ034LL]